MALSTAGSQVDRLHAVAATIAGHKAALVTLTAERDQLIRALSAEGLSLREIGAVAGISHVAAGQIVNRRRYPRGAKDPAGA